MLYEAKPWILITFGLISIIAVEAIFAKLCGWLIISASSAILKMRHEYRHGGALR